MATPHARGSTLTEDLRSAARLGYPACAGIDPSTWDYLQSHRGLPRMRGDRPKKKLHAARRAMATPHARGSTPLDSINRVFLPGYPACAGIDP